MSDQREEVEPDVSLVEATIDEEQLGTRPKRGSFKKNWTKYWSVLALITYIAGLGSGYMLWGSAHAGDVPAGEKAASSEHDEMKAIITQVNPPNGYELPIQFGDFAPKLVAAGVINYAEFVKLYEEIGSPLNDQQITF